jgi:hypothetical protein
MRHARCGMGRSSWLIISTHRLCSLRLRSGSGGESEAEGNRKLSEAEAWSVRLCSLRLRSGSGGKPEAEGNRKLSEAEA